MKRIISLILSLALICTITCGCSSAYKSPESSKLNSETTGLKVHFIDVGQGESILVESFGRFALIDGGEYSEKDTVISYLSEHGVKKLDYVFCTHPHSDHCGGLSEVIRTYTPAMFISPDADSDSDSWNYTLDAADERNVTYETPDFNSVYKVGEATITVLSPATDALYSDLNNYSLVCMVQYLSSKILLTGDAEALVEDELIRKGVGLSADILKCGHHGSSSSTSEAFLMAVSPSAAVISCGEGNKYGHPHDETLDILTKRNIPIMRTDTLGDITVTCDGKLIEISSALGEVTHIKPKNPTANTIASSQPETYTAVKTFYIGNKNSKVFHKSDCSSVYNMKKENKVELSSRDDAISQGYKPCGNCKP